MAITAADVKKLRDATGAGMMDAKKALTEADGDFEKAVEILRVSGAAKAAKRADREAANGLVASYGNALIHLGSETDFVAKNAEFVELGEAIAKAVDAAEADGKEAALQATLADGRTVGEAVAEIAAKIGEKIELADAAYLPGAIDVYLHKRNPDLPPQVGVAVAYEGEDAEFVHAVSLQIASMSPQYLAREDVPADVLAKEQRIAEETAKEEGKPEKIIPRIVEGRVNAFYKDVCLLEQASVADDKKTVGALAAEHGVTVTRFVRFAAGA
ncbi:translation elongation factor Ts [Propionibacterium australiense]|uniref:Elongation factor Ts n=1 Tax=Propionibacterium australiense TaxID=119981 RepID=A0A383S7N8_9ACTN|nr:translation elongation factor Ts [Propionibacterium australiense]RLP11090.1 elongation factor Ts [Propionibacterium australiense]RLP12414.1 elongation factor Ts [Propionibacterium australiense]SYZ34020.1 Translation elongation factor Ts, conserved site [Propionibacterium australiense]VEH91368.1 Elongation factor Ts [Propionibacterium australiense]